MPDVYAIITEIEDEMLERIANVLELRAADPQQKAMQKAMRDSLSIGRTP